MTSDGQPIEKFKQTYFTYKFFFKLFVATNFQK